LKTPIDHNVLSEYQHDCDKTLIVIKETSVPALPGCCMYMLGCMTPGANVLGAFTGIGAAPPCTCCWPCVFESLKRTHVQRLRRLKGQTRSRR
jgi:hypothetical protein